VETSLEGVELAAVSREDEVVVLLPRRDLCERVEDDGGDFLGGFHSDTFDFGEGR
jgi:hypothetical protein